MENFLSFTKKFYYQKIRKPVTPDEYSLIMQIRDTSNRLRTAYNRFENECNEDLLDSIIYEIQSLKALYRYQMKLAKESGLDCKEISVYYREVI